MILHLKNCGRQPDELRQQAEQLAVERKWIQGTSTSVASSSVVYHPQPIAPSPFHPMMTHISIPPPPQASQGALVLKVLLCHYHSLGLHVSFLICATSILT